MWVWVSLEVVRGQAAFPGQRFPPLSSPCRSLHTWDISIFSGFELKGLKNASSLRNVSGLKNLVKWVKWLEKEKWIVPEQFLWCSTSTYVIVFWGLAVLCWVLAATHPAARNSRPEKAACWSSKCFSNRLLGNIPVTSITTAGCSWCQWSNIRRYYLVFSESSG